ncbi:MAG: DUF4838 domain-containing protein [Armatimonadota bacterium]
MRHAIIMSIMLILGCAITGITAQAKPAWQNALKPKGKPGPELVLARTGTALYSILLPASPSTQEQKAAADLAMWLKQITGSSFSVQNEFGNIKPDGKVISIGKTNLLARSGSKYLKTNLADEGYAIDVVDGNLLLNGGETRGPINAVYALLEEDLGCRWYSRFSQTIPNKPTLRFRPVKRSYVPVLEIRDPYYWEAFDGTWSLRNRTNSSNASVPAEWGGNKQYALFVHTFSTLLPPDKYFKDHPEYFSEHNGQRDPGQLCVSNPEVVKLTAESVIRILRKNPNAQIISVSQNDSVPCCDCAICRAEAAAEGSLAGPLLKFVNAVADIVGKQYPKVRISTLAYLDTASAPKTVRPHKNVAIQLCTDSHAWSEPFLTIDQTPTFQQRMKDWAAMGADIHIWDYTCNFSHYPSPMPNWQTVAWDIDFFVKHNAKGVMLQGNYQTPGTGDGFMRCWVWAKQLWDPTLDTQSLMKDFVYGYYGKAADPIWDYEQLLWDTWENEHTGKLKSPAGGIRFSMDLFDTAFMSKARDCFDRATKLASDPETLHRVEEAKLQVLYADVCQMAQSGKITDKAKFSAALAEFERIGRRIKMTNIQEGGPDFEPWLSRMHSLEN